MLFLSTTARPSASSTDMRMTDDVYKKIKRQNGERFAQALRNYHSGLLQIEGIAEMVRHAGRDASPLLPYLMSLLASNDDKPVDALVLDPFVLLDQAGYDAFHADTLEKQNSIKKYFAPGELLCTFNDAARHQNYHIIHAVKKDVDKIRREDFNSKAERQDAYGTSVISIQIKKGGGFISIKNRYNHNVEHCDNTFDSNPDNIIKGLSNALRNHFNVEFSAGEIALPDGYVMIQGQIFKYNFERDNVYYGDQAWASEGTIYTVDRAAGDAVFDEFIFDNKTKTLQHIDSNGFDGFVDDFNDCYGGNKGLSVQSGNLMLDGHILIGAEESRITQLYLPGMTTLNNHSLLYMTFLKSFSAPDLQIIDNGCLPHTFALTEINVPMLTEMGEGCLGAAHHLKTFHAPALITMGDGCLQMARGLETFTAPCLKTMESQCLEDAPTLTAFIAPQLTSMGENCLTSLFALETLDLPRLVNIGANCLLSTHALSRFHAPVLRNIARDCLQYAPVLTQIHIPTVVNMDYGSLRHVTNLMQLDAPALERMGQTCLQIAPALKHLNAPLLQDPPESIRALTLAPLLVTSGKPKKRGFPLGWFQR